MICVFVSDIAVVRKTRDLWAFILSFVCRDALHSGRKIIRGGLGYVDDVCTTPSSCHNLSTPNVIYSFICFKKPSSVYCWGKKKTCST